MKNGLTLKEHSTSLTLLLRGIDCFCFFMAGLFSFWLRFEHVSLNTPYKSLLLLGIVLSAVSLSFFEAYRAWRGASFFSEIACISKALISTFLCLVLFGFLTHTTEIFSRIWVVTWLITSGVFLISSRFVLRRILGQLRAKGYNIRRVIIIGDSSLAQKVAHKLSTTQNSGLLVQGFIGNSIIQTAPLEHPYLGTIDNVDNIVKEMKTDQVWIALPIGEVEKMRQAQAALATSAVTIRLVPDIYDFQLLNHSITEVAGLPVINLSTSHMLEGKNRFLKSLEDKILSAIILICISPILIGLSIAIKLTSKGPILFKQHRTGANGRDFKVYKFRSMVVHNEEDGKVTQAKKGDSRVTPIGAFMRRTSLDELPQFINVLQGRMSIVGPRPHALAHNEYYKTLVESYMRRHMVKPGITGWAQVNGFRGETDTIEKMKNRVEYDLYYIENWSIWLDLRIITLTIFKGFINKNAF